jgi:cupin superfamily acireductone dioxygenase involved in methionine salvage
MPERNKPQKTLKSWEQIAASLDRSERTVRRWEANEGFPIDRLGHQKHDTVFAYKHEIEAWTRRRTRFAENDVVAGPLQLQDITAFNRSGQRISGRT